VALSTTRQSSADAAAKEFGVPHAFDNVQALVNHPDVDLVAVTVKVPRHLELVTAVLDAGKHIYCEWPLGNGLAEAEQMTTHARRTGLHAAVGMQARSAPAFAYLRDLIRDGYVGEVLSTSVIGSGMNWGAVIDQPNSYIADKRNGATMTTIPFGHSVDGICFCLGEFRELSATSASRRTSFTLAETGEHLPMDSADQLVVSGILSAGAVASLHYRGGMTRGGTDLLWEINGTEGDIQVSAFSGHMQIFELSLKGSRKDESVMQPLSVPDRYRHLPADVSSIAVNVGEAYYSLAADIRDGGHRCPTFEDAVTRHRMIAAIERAAATGMRQQLG
jgi:predicted dehydrogenase